MSFEEIRFDMSREGLNELAKVLSHYEFENLSLELQNFANEILNMLQREPVQRADHWYQKVDEPAMDKTLRVIAAKQESSWLDV